MLGLGQVRNRSGQVRLDKIRLGENWINYILRNHYIETTLFLKTYFENTLKTRKATLKKYI
jgi:hypothetical protein